MWGCHLPIVESLNDTPKLHLSGDISFELFARSGGGNTHMAGVLADLGMSSRGTHVAAGSAGEDWRGGGVLTIYYMNKRRKLRREENEGGSRCL